MSPKAKRGRLAVPAFYSIIGFIMAISLQATCNFVVRKLVLSYTKRPTFAPTPYASEVPTAAPSAFVPPTTAQPSSNGTLEVGTNVPTASSTGDGGITTGQPTIAGITTGAPTSFPTVSSTQNATLAPTAAGLISEVDGAGNDAENNDVGIERIRNRQLQNNVTTAVPTIAPTPNATTCQPTLFDNVTVEELEQRIIHKVGLWDWEVQDGVCVPYTVCIQTRACFSPAFDSAFNSARTFAVLSSMLGGVVTLVICASLCFPFNPIYLTPVYVLLMLFQGLSLMVYSSGICDRLGDVSFWLGAGGENIDPITGDLTEEAKQYEDYLTFNTEVSCTNGSGSKMAISAVVMWFLAAITSYWNVKRSRDI